MQVPEVREKADLTKYRNAGREVIQVRWGDEGRVGPPLGHKSKIAGTRNFFLGRLEIVMHAVLDPDLT